MFRDLSRREIIRNVTAGATIGGLLPGQAAGREEDDEVAFQELSPTAKKLFLQALREGEVTDVTGVDSKAVQPLIGSVHVEYQGDWYLVKGGRTYQSRTVFLPLETDDVIDGDAVARYTALSERGQAAVDTVVSGQKPSVAVDSSNLDLPRDATAVADQSRGDGPDVRIADGSEWSYNITVK